MSNHLVVGIDVGSVVKGYHAVALLDGLFVDRTTSSDPYVITDWCLGHEARLVAVDAPSGWSADRKSRQAERDLMGEGIGCFSTPTRKNAEGRSFYSWVFNGERLYSSLRDHYPLFDGEQTKEPMCIETFPHAIVCALAGRVVAAKPKARIRREVLRNLGYDAFSLPNIDFVDAALCAVAAEGFQHNRVSKYGNPEEGFIVVILHTVE